MHAVASYILPVFKPVSGWIRCAFAMLSLPVSYYSGPQAGLAKTSPEPKSYRPASETLPRCELVKPNARSFADRKGISVLLLNAWLLRPPDVKLDWRGTRAAIESAGVLLLSVLFEYRIEELNEGARLGRLFCSMRSRDFHTGVESRRTYCADECEAIRINFDRFKVQWGLGLRLRLRNVLLADCGCASDAVFPFKIYEAQSTNELYSISLPKNYASMRHPLITIWNSGRVPSPWLDYPEDVITARQICD